MHLAPLQKTLKEPVWLDITGGRRHLSVHAERMRCVLHVNNNAILFGAHAPLFEYDLHAWLRSLLAKSNALI